MGIFSALAGWNYHFTAKAPVRAQASAARATLDQFQSNPDNRIEGRGTLITQNGMNGGKYWNVIQPPQVFAAHTGVTESFIGAASLAGGLYGSPLLPNPDSSGLS